MTTKQLLNLLIPSIFFLIIGTIAFGLSNKFVCNHQIEVHLHEQQQRVQKLKFDEFATNLTNGAWQLTTDQWVERTRLLQGAIQSEKDLQLAQSRLTMSIAKLIRILGWLALAGFVCQIAAVIRFKRNNLNKT